MGPKSKEEDEGNFIVPIDKFNLSILSSIAFGFILMVIGLIVDGSLGFHFMFALGVSIAMGTLIGYAAYLYLDSPMGILLGLVIGLFIPPLVSALIKGPESSYFAAILGPAIGSVIGGLMDRISEDRERMELDRSSSYGSDPYQQRDQFQKE